MPEQSSPVVVTIADWDRRGHGVTTTSNQTITVPGALPGEQVSIEPYWHRRRHYGRVLDVLTPSPNRVPTECEWAATCPGCSLRGVHPDHQWRMKASRVLNDITRHKIVEAPFEKLGQMPPDEARSRAVAHGMEGPDGRLILGMRGRHNTLIPLSDCPVHTEGCRRLLARLQRDLNRLKFTVYDPETRTGDVRHVIVEEFISHETEATPRVGNERRERVVICFGRPIDTSKLHGEILRDMPAVVVLADILPYRGSSVVSTPIAIRNEPSITMPVQTDRLQATLPSWTPQSPKTSGILRNRVLEWLNPGAADRVLEVGCGIGTLTLPVARIAKWVTGIDACRTAIRDANANAKAANLKNIDFRMGIAHKALVRVFNLGNRHDLVILHGMRRPFGARAMAVVHALRPRRIVYIGPSARSIGEDIAELSQYSIIRVGGLDQTPGTVTMLTVLLLERIDA